MNPLLWQRPNATEAYAAEQLGSISGYLPFPWASWIDTNRDQSALSAPLASRPAEHPLATVGQHIEMLKHAALLRTFGITDLFWSHATSGLTHYQGLRIHPFPLFPVRCSTHPGPPGGIPMDKRRWLYSFQGVYRSELYLTPVRDWILALPRRNDALLESRREWHFEQTVYREQVHGQAADAQRHAELDSEASSYAETLQHSVFALCPSGSGPNSIRLWEALGYGCIPVILADTLALPGDPALWRHAALIIPETQEAVAALPEQLEALRSDSTSLKVMQAAGQQLWQHYGLPKFVPDLREFLDDPDQFLLERSLHQLPINSDVAVIRFNEPATFGVELLQQLRKIPSEQALALQILDQAPLPQLGMRWRAPLKLCTAMLAKREWTISCRCPALEQFSSTR